MYSHPTTITFVEGSLAEPPAALVDLSSLSIIELGDSLLRLGRSKDADVHCKSALCSLWQALILPGPRWHVVTIPTAKNPTLVDGKPVGVDGAPIYVGSLIRVGLSSWLAVDRWDTHTGDVQLVVRNLAELAITAVCVQGTLRAAGEYLGESKDRVHRWARGHADGDAILQSPRQVRRQYCTLALGLAYSPRTWQQNS